MSGVSSYLRLDNTTHSAVPNNPLKSSGLVIITSSPSFVRSSTQCAIAATKGIRYRRELDQNSTVINAVPGYDAVQAGIQRIYSIQPDGSEQMAATVRFTLIWTKKSGQWQLLRVISFDHR